MQMIYNGYMIMVTESKYNLVLNVYDLHTGRKIYDNAVGFSDIENAIDVSKSTIDRLINKNVNNGR